MCQNEYLWSKGLNDPEIDCFHKNSLQKEKNVEIFSEPQADNKFRVIQMIPKIIARLKSLWTEKKIPFTGIFFFSHNLF